MFNEFVLPELVTLAKSIIESEGIQALEDYKSYPTWCGCMGPKKGDILCPCSQSNTLASNLVEVIAEFNPELAKKIMIRRIVAALPG